MKDHHVPTAGRCPTCNMLMTGAGNANPKQDCPPKPGDLSVCSYCSTLFVYTEGMGTREATAKDKAELDREARIQLDRIQRLLQRKGGFPLPERR